jgi:hypothetical protein
VSMLDSDPEGSHYETDNPTLPTRWFNQMNDSPWGQNPPQADSVHYKDAFDASLQFLKP